MFHSSQIHSNGVLSTGTSLLLHYTRQYSLIQLYQSVELAKMKLSDFDVFLFDCDDTLYPESSGVRDKVRLNIEQFIMHRFGYTYEEAATYRDNLFRKYGTTLTGLLEEHEIDAKAYWAWIHAGADEIIHPNERLGKLLAQIPQPKFVFSNADSAHVKRVLNKLSISEFFCDPIIDVEFMQITVNKPDPQAFHIAFEAAKVSDPHRCIFFEDSIRNLEAAKKFGLVTILIDEHRVYMDNISKMKSVPFVDYIVSDVCDGLVSLFEELAESEQNTRLDSSAKDEKSRIIKVSDVLNSVAV